MLNSGGNDIHVLTDAPIVVLAEFLEANDTCGSHRDRSAASTFPVGELSGKFHLLRLGGFTAHAFWGVVFTNTLDRRIDDLGRHFQTAIHRAAQRLCLHYGDT